MDIWDSNGGKNQQWAIIPNSDGTFTLINKANNYVLDDAGNSTSNGTWMDMWPSNSGWNQEWELVAK